MPLVTSRAMLTDAYQGGYAIGAFNVNNLETIQGIVDAAWELRSPVILQVSRNARKYADPIYLKHLIDAATEKYPDLPLVCHLDHGDDFQTCVDCIESGFTSVMLDASAKPFAENIALTRQVVEYAHPRGVTVEAELGQLAGVEDETQAERSTYTDPDQAVEFVERTGIDSLAISVGTSHGAYKFSGTPQLDFPRLDLITRLLPDFPLVLHGASTVLPEFVDKCNQYGGQIHGAQGVPEDMLRRAAQTGVCKINIDTDIRLAFTASIRQHLATHPDHFDPRQYLTPARAAVKDMVTHKIKNVLGSAHRF